MSKELNLPTTEHSYADMFLGMDGVTYPGEYYFDATFQMCDVKELFNLDLDDCKLLLRRWGGAVSMRAAMLITTNPPARRLPMLQITGSLTLTRRRKATSALTHLRPFSISKPPMSFTPRGFTHSSTTTTRELLSSQNTYRESHWSPPQQPLPRRPRWLSSSVISRGSVP